MSVVTYYRGVLVRLVESRIELRILAISWNSGSSSDRRDQAAEQAMIGLRPIRSDRAPNTMKKPVPSVSDHAISTFVHLQNALQEKQGIELASVPDDSLACDEAEQCHDGDLGVRPLSECFRERRFRLRAFLLHFLEGRALSCICSRM